MKIAVISTHELAPTHGTGVQMLRLFGDGAVPFIHLHWWRHSAMPGGHPQSHCLRDHLSWPWTTGRGFARRVRDRYGWTWWPNGLVNERRLRSLLGRSAESPQAAYVVVCGEDDARRANSVLDALQVPAVVHVWDLDRVELAPAEMPAFAALLQRSHAVFALNESIAAQLGRFSSRQVRIVPFGAGYSATESGAREELIILSGSLGAGTENASAGLFADGLRKLRRRHSALRVVYFGAQSHRLPAHLLPLVDDKGFVSDEECGRLLARARVACLLTPDGYSSWDRHSIPSRVADYLASGLPLLALITRGNATHAMLSDPALGQAVRFPENGCEFANAASTWLSDDGAWRRAHVAAVAYAETHFSLARLKENIFDALSSAATSGIGGAAGSRAVPGEAGSSITVTGS